MQHPVFDVDAFNAVAEGVTEIQDTAQSLFFFIFFHHVPFRMKRVRNDPDQCRRRLAGSEQGKLRFIIEGFKTGEGFLIETKRHLGCFSQTIGDLTPGKGGQGGGINQDTARLIKGADDVFDSIQVNGGLPSDGRVHLGQDGSRNVIEIDAAHITGRGKT